MKRPQVLVVSVVAIAAAGCGGSDAPRTGEVAGFTFVRSPPDLLAHFRATARRVGYAVPCPTQVPEGLRAQGASPSGCRLEIVGAGGLGRCGGSWRGWVVGSSEVGDQHLVITASPRRLTTDAKVVNGPAWYPRARVRRLGPVRIHGLRIRAAYVPAATNDGSAFADHVAFIWSAGRHTYAIGFHDVGSRRRTLELNEALVRGIELVAP